MQCTPGKACTARPSSKSPTFGQSLLMASALSSARAAAARLARLCSSSAAGRGDGALGRWKRCDPRAPGAGGRPLGSRSLSSQCSSAPGRNAGHSRMPSHKEQAPVGNVWGLSVANVACAEPRAGWIPRRWSLLVTRSTSPFPLWTAFPTSFLCVWVREQGDVVAGLSHARG